MSSKLSDEKREQIHTALSAAGDKVLAKQNKARDTLEALKNTAPEVYITRLKALRWEGVAKAMQGETYSISDKDRKLHLNQEPEDSPEKIQLNKINDGEIRGHTELFIAYSRHADNLSARAKFFEVLGINPNDDNSTGNLSGAGFMFKQWVDHNVCTQLAQEVLEAGNKEKAESLLQWAAAEAGVFDCLSEDSEGFNVAMIRERTEEEKEAYDKLMELTDQIEEEHHAQELAGIV